MRCVRDATTCLLSLFDDDDGGGGDGAASNVGATGNDNSRRDPDRFMASCHAFYDLPTYHHPTALPISGS